MKHTVRHEWRPGPIDTISHTCNCVGPKNGQPLCPCQMKSVEVRDGRYIRIQDLGPVRKYDDEFITTTFGEI